MTDPSPVELAERYFAAWETRDRQALTEILAEDATYSGPLATAHNRDECIAGLLGLLDIVTGIQLHARLADDSDVISWFDLQTSVAAPIPTVNWSHVEHGKITRIRVTFDPRSLLAAGS